MKKTDMELQAIREKLRQLESEPVASDVLSMPWSTPGGPTPHRSAPRQSVSNASSPQAVAIETLKQRSGNQGSSTQSSAGNRRADALIAQEIYRLELHANNINERSQQQAAELLAMKRSAQQAALTFRRQGIHEHPQLDIISQLLAAYPSATVPHIDRNQRGHFELNHHAVDLHRAKQEALDTAETLRNRTAHAAPQSNLEPEDHKPQGHKPQGHKPENYIAPQLAPFTQPIASSADKYNTVAARPAKNSRQLRKHKGRLAAVLRRRFSQLVSRQQHNSKTQFSSDRVLASSAGAVQRPESDEFSWLDGTIWFSVAAIARIVLETIVLSYPVLRMPLLLILFSAISFSIYRVVVSTSPGLTPAFRLGIVLLGLFLGSSLS